MLKISLDEIVNGWIVTVFDYKTSKYLINEYVETRLAGLELLQHTFNALVAQEDYAN